MEEQVKMGLNRTGVQMAPKMSKEMVKGVEEVMIQSQETVEPMVDPAFLVRRQYQEESGPVGTVPLPGTFKGAFSSMMEKLKGVHAELLIDKLGERLAFERTGTRLYDAIIVKCTGSEFEAELPELMRIRADEARHFDMLWESIEAIGADPTAQTPCADVTAVESMGLMQVLNDPRTSFVQSLHAILIAELADADAWSLLSRMVREAGMDKIADRFDEAHAQEQEHLQTIREMFERLNFQQEKPAAH